ncbi:MAG: hypothetical protein RR951_06205, partial [Ruthenibacterium sp.]
SNLYARLPPVSTRNSKTSKALSGIFSLLVPQCVIAAFFACEVVLNDRHAVRAKQSVYPKIQWKQRSMTA